MSDEAVLARTATAAARTRGRADLVNVIASLQADVERLVDRVERLRVVSPAAAVVSVDAPNDAELQEDAVSDQHPTYPRRLPIGPVAISATTYAGATEAIITAAKARRRALVAATSAHGVALSAEDPGFAAMLREFEIVTPDGMPVRWALNLLHGAALPDRVYGPTLTLRVCEAAAREGVGVYFYGARPEVLEKLIARMPEKVPGLKISGYCSPPFRKLTPEEDAAHIQSINDSGAGILFVGLGCPRQERWAYEHREQLSMPVLCVGAAFDFHAGALRQAPSWFQDHGLEWLFRLVMEPRRLWRRYVNCVPQLLGIVGRQYLAKRLSGHDSNSFSTPDQLQVQTLN